MSGGYYRHPTLHGDHVVFVCEDDLWSVTLAGGAARRLTNAPGRASYPALSPDGSRLAFTGRDEGADEVYIMPAEGGEATRLTFLGAGTRVVTWTPEGDIVFSSNAARPFRDQTYLYALNPAGGEPQLLPTGPAVSLSYGAGGRRVIGRNTTDLARWKRYRGGRTGEVWLDEAGEGAWRKLTDLGANIAAPLCLGGRVYVVSDHEGVGNLYSCDPSGEDLRLHAQHDFYVRHPATDGERIVYHAGADLYVFEPETDQVQKVAVELRSSSPERKRKFVSAAKYLQGYALHPKGEALALNTRGKVYSLSPWEGAVLRHGEEDAARYHSAVWLCGGKRLALVSDASGEEALELHTLPAEDAAGEVSVLADLNLGRPRALIASPVSGEIAVLNHRNELVVVDVEGPSARVLDRSSYRRIQGAAWSPDGRWLAYGCFISAHTCVLKLCEVKTGEIHTLTEPVLRDLRPAFDPEGKYLYFISYRTFDPVYDSLHFDLGFPKGGRPYLLSLQADAPSPFLVKTAKDADAEGDKPEKKKVSEKVAPTRIDLEGIENRIVPFPVPEGRYGRVVGLKGKVLFSSYPVEGALGNSWYALSAPPAKGKLEVYDFSEQKTEVLVRGISSFEVSGDVGTVLYRAGNNLRLLKAGAKPPKDAKGLGRKSGWIDLRRVRVSVLPRAEWTQMFRETWRKQRDHFWTEDMSGTDWLGVFSQYEPLLERVATRSEVSDLLWEMQGELGTSHAYELGGDYRPEPAYHQGFLGADLRYDAETDSYEVVRIVRGDPWIAAASSPLGRSGANVQVGDRLVAVNAQRLSRDVSPASLLVNQAGSDVLLTVVSGGATRNLTVKTLRDERRARYRDWVAHNRARVHAATEGRVGYLHVPDMGPHGYAEFHRGLLGEAGRDGLIIDVRYNGGGHVSELLLEKLARERRGYSVTRWGQPEPAPDLTIEGPLVALTNESAGSDGDIFSHSFKMMNLGPLVGKRTWGGVVGINGEGTLSDGSVTTQPEYAYWFNDVGWQVENYGTDPTVEVDIRPQDAAAGKDPQLERAVTEALSLLEAAPVTRPDFSERPYLGPKKKET